MIIASIVLRGRKLPSVITAVVPDNMKKLLIIISFISTNIYGQHLDFAFKLGGSYEDECYDMAIDTQMNIYITGGFCNEVDFNPNGTPFILTSNNTDRASAFLAKYDSNVNLVWAFSLKGDSWVLSHLLNHSHKYSIKPCSMQLRNKTI